MDRRVDRGAKMDLVKMKWTFWERKKIVFE